MKTIAAVALVAALAVVGTWFLHGSHLGTLTEKPIETASVDAFGDTVTTTTWVPAFEIGLDVAIPAAVGFALIGGTLIAAGAERRRLRLAGLAAGGLALAGAVGSVVAAYIAL